MGQAEQITSALTALSSRIRSIVILQIAATIAVALAAAAGYNETQEARVKASEYIYFRSDNLNGRLGDIERSWEYDSVVIYHTGESYTEDVLSKVSVLLLTETLFIGHIQIAMEKRDPNFDNSIAEGTEKELADLVKKINLLRQALPTLKVAVEQGQGVKSLTRQQLKAYQIYLDFNEGFSENGSFSKIWTKACKTAAIIRHIAKSSEWSSESDDLIQKVIMSPRGSAALEWADNQLVRRSDNAGDFISQLEYLKTNEIGASVLGLLELAGEIKGFTTPRAAAIELSYGFIDQQKSKSSTVQDLLYHLNKVDQNTIVEAKKELERRQALHEALKNGRNISIPFIDAKISRNQIWIIVLANIVFLVVLLRLRATAFNLTLQLLDRESDWKLAMDVAPQKFIYPIRSWWLWLWEIHYLTLGIFGLSLSALLIYFYPSEHGLFGWLIIIGCYLLFFVAVLVMWLRFRHPDKPHPLGAYHIFNWP